MKGQRTYIQMSFYFDLPEGVHPKPGTPALAALLESVRTEMARFSDLMGKNHSWEGHGHAFMVRQIGRESIGWIEQRDNPNSPEWKP